jgi:hypothetical protein
MTRAERATNVGALINAPSRHELGAYCGAKFTDKWNGESIRLPGNAASGIGFDSKPIA